MRYLTPLYDALQQYAGQEYLRLHMPGHAGRMEMNQRYRQFAEFDVTEVPGMDDWHAPTGCIAQANQYLADAYGAKAAVQLINGSSSGITGLFTGAFAAGDRVLIPRGAHRSFYSGLVLSGASPVYVPVELHENWPIPITSAEMVLRTMEQEPQLKGIFLVNPTFYGTHMELQEIAKKAKDRNIPLFVDQAHGAHFVFHSAYPPTALEQGASAAVFGLHKTLPVLTPGAALGFADITWQDKVRPALSLLNTTSPSYPLMASIDWGRAYMQEHGEELLEKAKNLSIHYQRCLSQLAGLRVLNREYKGAGDYLKVVLGLPGWKIDGYQLAEILRKKFKIQVEMVEEQVITAMMSPFHEAADWERLYASFAALADRHAIRDVNWKASSDILPVPKLAMTPRQAYYAPKRTIKLQDSRGKISGTLLVPYPPGIPLLVPGEIINNEVLERLQALLHNGHHLQGINQAEPKMIAIIDD